MKNYVRQILEFLPPGAKLRGLIVLMLFLSQALVEVVGVTSILPFMALAAQPSVIQTQAELRWVYDSLGFSDAKAFVTAAGLVVLAALTLSNAVTATTTWASLRYFAWLNTELSGKLLTRYLSRSYQWFLGQNVAMLSQTLLNETAALIYGVLLTSLRLISRAVAIVLITLILFWADPIVASGSAVTLGLIYAVIFSTVKKRLILLSADRVQADAHRFKATREALEGIKATIVQGRKSYFLRQFTHNTSVSAEINARLAFLSEAPRYLLELLAFGSVILIIIFLFQQKGDIRAALPILSLYTFAAYRLLPAMQQSFGYIASIRMHLILIPAVHKHFFGRPDEFVEMGGELREGQEPLPLDERLSIQNVFYRYPKTDQFVLNGVSLDIQKNTTVAFVGSTGAGKTTLVDLILGLLEPSDGQLLVDGSPLNRDNIRNWQRNIGYVPQDIYLTDDTVRANIAFGLSEENIDDARVEQAARLANLHSFIEGLPAGYQTLVGDRGVRLSGGQRQRIGIARALYSDPSLLILDEATSSLDGITESAVMDAVHGLANKKTILMIAHRLTTVRNCDCIYLLEAGKVAAQGTYDELITSNQTFQRLAAAGAQSET